MEENFKCHYTEEQRKEHEKRFIAEKPKDCMESIDHPSGVKVGDMVVVRNAYDILVGPYKVLGFTTFRGEIPAYPLLFTNPKI